MKRLLDLVAASIGIAILWPIIAVAIVMVRRETPGPGIFRQIRVGRHQQPFMLYKIRTMHVGTAQDATHQIGASACTKIGAWARRYKIDELPQLFNVIRGDMSLVGPRPCLPVQFELIEARQREGAFEALPGITGLAQVQGVDMSEPVRLAAIDGNYARAQSLAGDLRILVATLRGRGIGLDWVKE